MKSNLATLSMCAYLKKKNNFRGEHFFFFVSRCRISRFLYLLQVSCITFADTYCDLKYMNTYIFSLYKSHIPKCTLKISDQISCVCIQKKKIEVQNRYVESLKPEAKLKTKNNGRNPMCYCASSDLPLFSDCL